MSLAHRSVATIKGPEFINLTPLDINPLMSSCEIKVFYLGENRNRSYISKQVAIDMAKTLRGAPIVGYYKPQKEDFVDHGEQVIIDSDGVHFKNKTRPYGFVSPDAKVWFKDFEQEDGFGNVIIRTYLMTTGYLWTGQYEEAKKVFEDDGKPHSMELEKKTIQGQWTMNPKKNIEFFIINDAIFEKLCILGDKVEPCFEGSSVTEPEISRTFSLDENFKHTLFTMMEELKYALEGGNTVKKVTEELTNPVEIPVATEFVENQVNENQSSSSESVNGIEETPSDFSKKEEEEKKDEKAPSDFKKEEDDKEKAPEKEDDSDKGEDKKDDSKAEGDDKAKEDDDEDKKKNGKFELLQADYEALQSKYAALEKEVESLRTFKKDIEDQQKDSLIKEFYMLSDEDMKDVLEHKSEYSLEEIKTKLALIGFEKRVNFGLVVDSENEEQVESTDATPVTTFDIKATQDSTTPEWVRAVESAMKNRY